jgi:hypothetical protein
MNTDPASPLNKDAYEAFRKRAELATTWQAFLAGWVACRDFYDQIAD